MMVSVIVQFREAETDVAYVRSKGINPNELARDAFQQAVHHLRSQDRYEAIRRVRFPFPEPARDAIRSERERR